MPDTIRGVVNATEAKAIINHLKNWQGAPSKQWKVRANRNQTVIEKGEPFGYAEMVKGLSTMQQQQELSGTDKQHLHHGLEFLAEELAHALGKTQDRVRELIEHATQPGAMFELNVESYT